MNFRKVNNLTGWAVFLAALATYILTREARGSLWDTGEFIASAQKLQLPHPPGAPVFVLLVGTDVILVVKNTPAVMVCVHVLKLPATSVAFQVLVILLPISGPSVYVMVTEL